MDGGNVWHWPHLPAGSFPYMLGIFFMVGTVFQVSSDHWWSAWSMLPNQDTKVVNNKKYEKKEDTFCHSRPWTVQKEMAEPRGDLVDDITNNDDKRGLRIIYLFVQAILRSFSVINSRYLSFANLCYVYLSIYHFVASKYCNLLNIWLNFSLLCEILGRAATGIRDTIDSQSKNSLSNNHYHYWKKNDW